MADQPPLSQLELTGTQFANQPTCWQNFVREVKQEHPESYLFDFQKVTNQKLEAWRLTYVRRGYSREHSMIQGSPEDLTAWMLAYG
jgi:hypothetical protein